MLHFLPAFAKFQSLLMDFAVTFYCSSKSANIFKPVKDFKPFLFFNSEKMIIC